MYIGLRYTGWLGAAYGADVAAILSFLIMYFVLKKTVGITNGRNGKMDMECRTVEIFGYLKKNRSMP